MADAYQNLFEDLFNCIEKDTGDIFNFYHIHGRGLGCIIADQHKVQALGLGRYLNSKYPNLTPVEHLQHIYKLCQVHYKRNIDKNKQISSEIRSAIDKSELARSIQAEKRAAKKRKCKQTSSLSTVKKQKSNSHNKENDTIEIIELNGDPCFDQ
ncbi:hypothetical protein RhiirA1_466925 [Rhizophagus irregularis]|uniref:Uncharacterized protein n=1 Tax=Rhizophagus irregularis TaxID=588596 RepID=A0A2N0RD01_9GLOM|nr:hypothetical protein RhiirA1_466925 [Rhizophagus irregularis]